MSQYKHGVYVRENPTRLVTPNLAESAMPVMVGVAPVHRLPEDTEVPVNVPRLLFSMSDFEAQFGVPDEDDEPADFTLWQAARVYFDRYRVTPIVAVNVFDPAKHVSAGEDGTDRPDPTAVTANDIIGGTGESGRRTGLALIDEVFPRFRLTPGIIMAPQFSKTPAVAKAIETSCKNISGFFRATGLIEISDEVTRHTDAPAWLNDNNLCDKDGNTLAMFGDCLYAGEQVPGSAHLAGCLGGRDQEEDGVPYWSRSNYQMECEGMVHAGRELHLTPLEANYLNGQGIITGLNMIGGLRLWGDQTTAYPGVTDVKEASIPIRRMFSWVGNTLILTCWQHVSSPVRRRFVENVQDVVNTWLNGLSGSGYILGVSCSFEGADNPTLDIMDGKVRWHVRMAPPSAGRELEFILEYDPSYLNTLFATSALTA